ncbi:MAG: F0F1 ATP synthase subunit A [Saprospiraceae bacterium]
MRRFLLSLCCLICLSVVALAQHDHNHDHDGHDHSGHSHATTDHHGAPAGVEHSGCIHIDHEGEPYDPTSTAFHHIADANVYSIGPWSIPLPCILYAPEKGLSTFMSSAFNIGHHGSGCQAHDGYVLNEGTVMRVVDSSFPKGEVEIAGFGHAMIQKDDKEVEKATVVMPDGKSYLLDKKSTLDGGLLGGGISSFYDFSITKNVVSMLLVVAFLFWLFGTAAKGYRTREGQAPKGVQSFMEPFFVFIQDEVAKPFIGPKWEKHLPFLMAIFFFILGLNLFGQIPFLGGANATGNLAVTMALAIFAFLVVNLNGNKHYWEHILWMPGIPAWVKTIITPVEFLGVFIKPFTLMLRLFANITAGHIVVLTFVGLIFIFGDKGAFEWGIGREGGSLLGGILAIALTLFMMAIELLVAFVQAFVFTILTASYIGAAVEEHHHDDHAEAHAH